MREGTVVSRKRSSNGELVGTATNNPVTDSRIYNIDFGNGNYDEYSTNVLAENLYAHVDKHGQFHAMLVDIIDHMSDDSAIKASDGTFQTNHGTKRKRITTKGWKLKIEWCDGTSSWIPLKDIKESNPLEVAQYAKDRNIIQEPAFSWWVPRTLRKRDRIIKQVRHRIAKKNMKFGIKVPANMKEARDLFR
jgi:hypothetical protein